MMETISIDHIILEQIRDEKGGEYTLITRFGREGEPLPSLEIGKGDSPAAFGFLSLIAELLGVQIVEQGKK